MANDAEHGGIELPAPTSYPIYFAFGITLLFFGLVTHPMVSWVGLGAALIGGVGWWRQVLPHEQEELVSLQPEAERKASIRPVSG